MPRLKRAVNRHDALRKAIHGSMDLLERTYTDLAPVMGCTRQTVSSKIRDPDKMTLGEFRKLCLALGIPVEEARELIRF